MFNTESPDHGSPFSALILIFSINSILRQAPGDHGKAITILHPSSAPRAMTQAYPTLSSLAFYTIIPTLSGSSNMGHQLMKTSQSSTPSANYGATRPSCGGSKTGESSRALYGTSNGRRKNASTCDDRPTHSSSPLWA